MRDLRRLRAHPTPTRASTRPWTTFAKREAVFIRHRRRETLRHGFARELRARLRAFEAALPQARTAPSGADADAATAADSAARRGQSGARPAAGAGAGATHLRPEAPAGVHPGHGRRAVPAGGLLGGDPTARADDPARDRTDARERPAAAGAGVSQEPEVDAARRDGAAGAAGEEPPARAGPPPARGNLSRLGAPVAGSGSTRRCRINPTTCCSKACSLDPAKGRQSGLASLFRRR